MVSPLTSPCENWRPASILWQNLLPHDIETIKDKIISISQVNCAVLVVPQVLMNLKLVSPKMDRFVSIPFWLMHWMWNNELLVLTKWIPLSHPTNRRYMRKSWRNSAPTIIKLSTTPTQKFYLGSVNSNSKMGDPTVEEPRWLFWIILAKSMLDMHLCWVVTQVMWHESLLSWRFSSGGKAGRWPPIHETIGFWQVHMCWEPLWQFSLDHSAVCDMRPMIALAIIKAYKKAAGAGQVSMSSHETQNVKWFVLIYAPCYYSLSPVLMNGSRTVILN